MNDFSAEDYRDILDRRIASNVELLLKLQDRIAELGAEAEDIERRNARAVELYRAEFGEMPRAVARAPIRSRRVDRSPSDLSSQKLELWGAVPPTGPLTGLSWQEGIEHVLKEADRPLHVKEIWDGLAAGGFRTDSRDPLRSIAAIGVRTPAMLRVRPNTYALGTPSLISASDDGKE